MHTQLPRPSGTVDDHPPFWSARLALLVVTAVACLTASAFHAGLTLPLGSLTLAEPAILPAALVEGAIGILLAASAVAQWTRQRWARQLTLNAYIVGIVGFAVGIAIVLRNPDLQTSFNVSVHAGVFPLLLVGLELEIAAGRRDASRGREAA